MPFSNDVFFSILILCAVFVVLIIFFILKIRNYKTKIKNLTENSSEGGKETELDKVNDSENLNKISELEKHLESLVAEKTKLEQQVSELENNNNKTKIDQLNSEIETYKNELGNLKKQNKKIQNEKQDLEDDLEDEEAKNKKLKSELNEKESELAIKQKEISEKSKENEKLEDENEELKNEKNKKQKSLEFISEILTAKIFKTNNSSVNDKKVEAVYDFIKEDILVFFEKNVDYFDDIDKDLFDTDLEHWRAIKKKNWLNKKKTIAFIGEFSAGKTSILNSILLYNNPNEKTLPVKMNPTTAIPTYISHGLSTTTTFYTPDNIRKIIKEETFAKVDKDLLEDIKGISSLIKYFIIVYKNKNLKDLSILDTPGFSSNDKTDSEKTLEVVNECDALFWVIDVNEGSVNESSLNIIKTYLKRPLYVIINKVDTKTEEEVEKVIESVKNIFEKNNQKIENILTFSTAKEQERNKYVESLFGIFKNIPKNSSSTNAYEGRLIGYLEEKSSMLEEKDKDLYSKRNQLNELIKESDENFDKTKSNIRKGFDSLKDDFNSIGDSIKRTKKTLFGNYKLEPQKIFDKIEEGLTGFEPLNLYLSEMEDDIKKNSDLRKEFKKIMKDTYNLRKIYDEFSNKKTKLENQLNEIK